MLTDYDEVTKDKIYGICAAVKKYLQGMTLPVSVPPSFQYQ
jgi:hypothetical protein